MKKFAVPTAGICALILVLTLQALNAVPAQNAASEGGPGAVRWEYKVVYAPRDSGFISGQELESKLNKLGLEGWECVGAVSDVKQESTYGHVIMKRAKS